jgi:hypothetical protein
VRNSVIFTLTRPDEVPEDEVDGTFIKHEIIAKYIQTLGDGGRSKRREAVARPWCTEDIRTLRVGVVCFVWPELVSLMRKR